MASGDPVVHQLGPLSGTGTNYAQATTIAGGSSPTEVYPAWLFSGTTTNYLDYPAELINYAGGGLTFRIKYACVSNGGTVQWEVAIRAVPDAAEDLDTAHTYSYQTTSVTVPGTTGQVDYATVTLTDGAQIDSWADDTLGIVRVRRNPGGTDTATNCQLIGIVGLET